MSGTAGPRRIPLAPAEGWVTLLLTMLLVLTVAWSINDAQWVLGRVELTDFLPAVAVLSVLWGFFAAKVGWGRLRSYVLGAIVGALVVPIIVGYVLEPDGGSLHAWFVATADATVNAYLDLAWRNRALTQEFGHFMLVLGLLVWATGMFAGYATFGRHRPINAVVVTGFVLIANMSITIRDQIWFLVIFTLAALLILTRVHATNEALTWVRRRLGDPSGVSSLYVRGGAVFATLAIVGSLFLTATASSAPLASVWDGVDQQLIDISAGIQRWLPRGGPGTKITGVSFGPQASITGRWVTDTSPALQIALAPEDRELHYWRAVAYDLFDLNGWSMSENVTVERAADAVVLDQTAEIPPVPEARHEVSYTVQPLEFRGATIFTPDVPLAVDRPTRLTLVGDGQYFGALEATGGSGSYRVRALVPTTGDATPGGLTENRLRAAGQNYPDLIRSLYLAVPSGSMGPDAQALLKTIRELAPLDDPLDLARTTEQYLRSPAFTYTTDLSSIDCGDRSVVECFAHFRQGYCQYYATTMAIVLRSAGVPARFVQGFLPGERNQSSGQELVRYSNSHAWVEVYFPGYGWVPFDPTGGGVAQLAPLPTGVPRPIPSLTPGQTGGARRDEADPTIPIPGGSGSNFGSTGGPGTGPFIALAVLLGVSVGVLAFAAYRRGPRGPVTAETTYTSISRLAARLGFAPRPTETVYEFTGSLADVLPGSRPDLETVAQAKVEVAYGHRELGGDRMQALRRAQQRLRVALLRLVVRRGGRVRR